MQHPENQFYSIHQYKNSMCKAIIETGLNSSIQLALSSKTLCISNFEMLQRGIWQLLTSFIASIKFNWNSSEILTRTFLEDWIQNNLEMKVIYNMRSTGKFCPLQILSRSCKSKIPFWQHRKLRRGILDNIQKIGFGSIRYGYHAS